MQTNYNTYVYPDHPPAQPQPARVQTSGTEDSICLGMVEIILRVISLLFCSASLGAAAWTLKTIDDIETYGDLEHAESYRWAAGWLIFVGTAAVMYHGTMIFLRILYCSTCAANIRHSFAGFSFTNVALCIVFGLALLAGAVANVVYSNDNADFYDNTICSSNISYIIMTHNLESCDDLESLYSSEGAAAAFAIWAIVLFIPIFIIALVNGIRKKRELFNQGSHNVASGPYVHLPNEF